jgi:hypothetical protein
MQRDMGLALSLIASFTRFERSARRDHALA